MEELCIPKRCVVLRGVVRKVPLYILTLHWLVYNTPFPLPGSKGYYS